MAVALKRNKIVFSHFKIDCTNINPIRRRSALRHSKQFEAIAKRIKFLFEMGLMMRFHGFCSHHVIPIS